MLKEAIEKIVSLANPEIRTLDGHTYIIDKNGDYTELRPDYFALDEINLTSLDAMVQFIRNEGLSQTDGILFVTIPSPVSVRCFTSPNIPRRTRTFLYEAKATDVPGWSEKMQLGFEEAQIALRTRFQHTNDTEYAQKLLSDISTGCKVTYNDNGVATNIVTQQGVSLQSKVQIRPLVNLRPYRTFQEIEQPASDFLIRINDRYISFIEADGGMWKLAARTTIKTYLEEELKGEISVGRVVVTL